MTLFETERLLVRQINAGDFEDLYRVYRDPEAMRWVDDGQPIGEAACREWIEITGRNYATRGYGMSALVLRETGGIIGFCGIVHPGGQIEPEIKYALDRRYWGRGLATEAVRGMLDHAASHLGLSRIIATTAPENEASHRVLQKCGMSDLETVREKDGSFTKVWVWNARPDTPGAS